MKDYDLLVIKNQNIGDGLYKLTLGFDEPLPRIIAGQFANVKLPDSSKILRRPLCISDYDTDAKTVTLIYKIRGGGTRILSQQKRGARLQVLLPLGNGFPIEPQHKRIMMIGGGTGSVVFPSVITQYPDREYYYYTGFSTKSAVVCKEQKARVKKAVIATDDGSLGTKGNVVQAALADIPKIKPDIVLCCGPDIIYSALKKGLPDIGYPLSSVFVSLEGRMCCGFGACFVCACKILKNGEVKTLRVCKNGPVFDLASVTLNP